jgi:hypothetical protein
MGPIENADLCLRTPAKSKGQSYITEDSQSVSLSWCQAPIWDPRPIFPLSLIILDSCGFVDVGRPLWREVGSLVFSFSWASPAQLFSDLSPTGLTSLFYCLYFWDSHNLQSQIPVFISPRNSVAQLYSRTLGCVLSSGSGYFATDGQSASLSWCRAPMWGPWPDFYYCRTFAVFMFRGALPDEKTGL